MAVSTLDYTWPRGPLSYSRWLRWGLAQPCRRTGGEGSPGPPPLLVRETEMPEKHLFCFVASEHSGACHAQTGRHSLVGTARGRGRVSMGGGTTNSHGTLASGSWHTAVMETLAF